MGKVPVIDVAVMARLLVVLLRRQLLSRTFRAARSHLETSGLSGV